MLFEVTNSVRMRLKGLVGQPEDGLMGYEREFVLLTSYHGWDRIGETFI